MSSVQPARAQTRIYVAGDLFAEFTRPSRASAPEALSGFPDNSPRDGVTMGGGGRVGAFFTPAWSLEIGLDVGQTLRDEETGTIRATGLTTIPLSLLRYPSRASHRFTASSVLLGYHPPPRGRLQAGFRGGVSFAHTERMFTYPSLVTTFPDVLLPGRPLVPIVSVSTDEYGTVTNGLTATLAAEAAIDLSHHLAVVPEVRAHAGGIGGIVLRPGVAVRWRW